MQRQALDTLDLTPDLLIEIFSQLDFDSTSLLKKIFIQLGFAFSDNLLDKYAKEASLERRNVEEVSSQAAIILKKVFKGRFKDVPDKIVILMCLVEVGDCEQLKKIFSVDDLTHSCNLLNRILESKNQAIFNMIFELIQTEYNKRNEPISFYLSDASISNSYSTYSNPTVSLLHWAVFLNQPCDIVNDLISTMGNPEMENEMFWYGRPLQIAAAYDYVELVLLLLKNNAQVVYEVTQYSTITALGSAVSGNSINTATVLHKWLLANRPELLTKKHLNDKLYCASQNGHTQAVEFMLSIGAEINARGIFGMTSLSTACAHKHVDTVSCLLAHGADPNIVSLFDQRNTPPIVTAAYYSPKIVELLFEKGAEINAVNSSNTTALYIAVQEKNVPLATFLLENKADVHISRYPESEKFTPLSMAAETGLVEMIELLIKHGADVNAACGNGMTSLHYAVKSGNHEAVTTLLKHGADMSAKSNNKTALDLALEEGKQDIVDALNYRCHIFKEKNQQSNHVNLSLLNNRRINRDHSSLSNNSTASSTSSHGDKTLHQTPTLGGR